jgi:hypothetical protein
MGGGSGAVGFEINEGATWDGGTSSNGGGMWETGGDNNDGGILSVALIVIGGGNCEVGDRCLVFEPVGEVACSLLSFGISSRL